MNKRVPMEGRGIIPCSHNVGEVHVYRGPPMVAEELLVLLGRAAGRHAQLGVAVDNLRAILIKEGLLCEEPSELSHGLLEDVRQALELAQAVIPGVHRETLVRITRALERIDACQDSLPRRGQA